MDANKMRKISTLLVLLSGVTVFQTQAMTLKQYQAYSQHEVTKERTEFYVVGIAHGADLTNSMVGVRNGGQLYCKPPKLMLDAGVVTSLISQEIRQPLNDNPYSDETPIEMIVINALRNRFGCRADQPPN